MSKHESSSMVKEIRSLGSWFRISNLLSLKNGGRCFIYDLLKSQESTVFKVDLTEPTIMLCDHTAAQYIYDDEYVTSGTFFGKDYNTNMVQGRVPSMFCNGEEHRIHKQDTMKLIKYRLDNTSLADMSKVIETEMKAINMETQKNFEHAIEQVARSVATQFLLGKVLHDVDSWREWFEKSVYIKALSFFSWGEDRIAEENIERIRQTPTVKNLDTILPDTTQTKEEETLELTHNANFNCTPILSWVMLSCIVCFRDSLSDTERMDITAEAEEFLKQDPTLYEEKKLKLIDAFVSEVIRFHTPILGPFRRAKKDFIMDSSSGRYQVHKGEMMTAFVYAIHRDEAIFDDPLKFKLCRDTQTTKRHNHCFGGPFIQEATPENMKCPGQDIMFNVLKLFVVHLTRCTISITSDTTFTGKTLRFVATDEPLIVNKFVYNKDL